MNRVNQLLFACILLVIVTGCATSASRSDDRDGGIDSASPVRAAEINTRLGLGYLERGELRVAMEKLETALRHDPEHVPAHLTLALIHENLGDDGNAGRHYRAAARLAPNDGGTQNSYAVFLCRQRDFKAADTHFMTATRDRFYTTPEVAWTNAGACARRSGDIEQASNYLRQALEINPNFPDALYHLAEIYYQQGEAFRARAFLQRFEATANPEAGALLLGYRIESSLGNQAQADQYISRLERDFPETREAAQMRRLMEND